MAQLALQLCLSGTSLERGRFACGSQAGQCCTLLERGPGRTGEIWGTEAAAKAKCSRKIKTREVSSCIKVKASRLCSCFLFFHFAPCYWELNFLIISFWTNKLRGKKRQKIDFKGSPVSTQNAFKRHLWKFSNRPSDQQVNSLLKNTEAWFLI